MARNVSRAAKKAWKKPDLKRMVAGSAESDPPGSVVDAQNFS